MGSLNVSFLPYINTPTPPPLLPSKTSSIKEKTALSHSSSSAMDFHSLTRRELQALCKKNKIAANMTNIAMVDALKALQHVEGMEELLNPSESENPQSPEKPVIGSPDIPRTACRTSTRRRPIKEEPENSRPLTQTRRGTRRNQMESSVQRVYSTRRSARLAEKDLAVLSLKERGRTDPIKIDDLSKEGLVRSDDSNEVQENNKGADLQTKAEEGLERLDEGNNCEVDNLKVSDKSFNELINNEVEDEVCENKAADLQTQPEVGCEITDELDESDVLSGESLEKAVELNDEIIEKNGHHTAGNDFYPVTLVLSDAEKLNEVLNSENEHNQNADQNLEEVESQNLVGEDFDMNMAEDHHSIQDPESKFASEVQTVNVLESVVNDSSGDTKKPELNSLNLSACADHHDQNLGVECQNLVSDGFDMNMEEDYSGNQDPKLKFTTEVIQMVGLEQLGGEKEPEILFVHCTKSKDDSGQVVTDSNNATDTFACERTADIELGIIDKNLADQSELQVAVEFSDQESMNFDSVMVSGHTDNPMPEMGKCNSDQSELQVAVDFSDQESMNFDSVMVSDHTDGPMPEMGKFNSEAWVVHKIEEVVMSTTDECLSSLDKTQVKSDLSDGKDTGEIPFSTLAVDPLLGDIPCPKSSSKKQTTIRRVMVLDDNKENIDNSGRKVEPRTAEKGKKIRKDTAEDATLKSLNDASLRQLTKMLKEKLNITNDMKNNDNKNVSKQEVGKMRPALQTLTENCMAAAGEPEREY